MKATIAVLVLLVIGITAAYVSWQVERRWNYKFGYQEQVRSEILETVKKECLK